MALKWNDDAHYNSPKGKWTGTSPHNGPTDWFILPFDFAAAIGKMLIHKQALGLEGFNPDGMEFMKKWLIEKEAISDSMSY